MGLGEVKRRIAAQKKWQCRVCIMGQGMFGYPQELRTSKAEMGKVRCKGTSNRIELVIQDDSEEP